MVGSDQVSEPDPASFLSGRLLLRPSYFPATSLAFAAPDSELLASLERVFETDRLNRARCARFFRRLRDLAPLREEKSGVEATARGEVSPAGHA